MFFLSDGCMAQRCRCPGGRPSVSANKGIHDAYYSVVKWQLYKPSMNTEYDPHFFCLMAAWLNEGRCPGGRPSVSTNYITIEASVFCIEMTTVHAIYTEYDQQSPRECRYRYWRVQ